jgi:hypothetical protein
VAAITSSPPTTGKVHVNEVIVSVRAMKTTPTSPPRLSPCAEAFSRELGRRSSKRPSRLRPKAKNSRATARFSQGALASLCKAAAPKRAENSTPISVKMPMIARQ